MERVFLVNVFNNGVFTNEIDAHSVIIDINGLIIIYCVHNKKNTIIILAPHLVTPHSILAERKIDLQNEKSRMIPFSVGTG